MSDSKLDQIKAHLKELDRLEIELQRVVKYGLHSKEEHVQNLCVIEAQALLSQMTQLIEEAQAWKAELAGQGIEELPEIPKLPVDR